MGVETIPTTPIEGQKPGTSGLRKKVKIFQEGHYLHNFVQSVFDALPASDVKGCTLLVSGDGRYFNREAIQIIAEICAGNGVGRMWVGHGGLVSTPAASAIIREREGGVCYGGILLTASHNAGGPENDFGIKYNTSNGGPALEVLTDKIYEKSKTIKEFKKVTLPALDINTIGRTTPCEGFVVEVINTIEDWMKLMKDIFDFDLIRKLIQRKDFTFVYDALNGVAGPYAKAVFIDELKADPSCLCNCESKEDFGGGHPDPNLTYAKDLVKLMKPLTPEKVDDTTPDFGAAGDGDNDRNMILGKGFFVTPSDSVAIIAAYALECIPYFKKSGLKGVGRSMATSCSLDAVAKKLKIDLFETATGWKFFCNLMDAGRLQICGEESFGTGSDHIREKDGLWAVLAWMSILAFRNADSSKSLVTVQQISEEFWKEFGRNYYTRYDYEEVDVKEAHSLMDHLLSLSEDLSSIPNKIPATTEFLSKVKVSKIDNFTYVDPVDNSKSINQGIRCLLEDGSRIVWRLSGTGSVGATVRIYIEKYDRNDIHKTTVDALKGVSNFGLALCKIQEITGRTSPTVIT